MSEGNDSRDGAIQPACLELNKRQQGKTQSSLGQGAVFRFWTSCSTTPHAPNKQFSPFFQTELLEFCFSCSLPHFFCSNGVGFVFVFKQKSETPFRTNSASSTARPHLGGDGAVAWLWSHHGKPQHELCQTVLPGSYTPRILPSTRSADLQTNGNSRWGTERPHFVPMSFAKSFATGAHGNKLQANGTEKTSNLAGLCNLGTGT